MASMVDSKFTANLVKVDGFITDVPVLLVFLLVADLENETHGFGGFST